MVDAGRKVGWGKQTKLIESNKSRFQITLAYKQTHHPCEPNPGMTSKEKSKGLDNYSDEEEDYKYSKGL